MAVIGQPSGGFIDPRDDLEKARRGQLWRFAAEHGIKEIEPGMAATLMREILRKKGHHTIGHRLAPEPAPRQQIVSSDHLRPRTPAPAETKPPMSVEEIARQDYERQKRAAAAEAEAAGEDLASLPMPAVRLLCKRAGIGFRPADKKVDLIARLEAVDRG
jgi:hypothetical protein